MSISEPEEVVITGSPAETRALAARLAGELRPGSVLALHGDLGSGKTCFVQGLAEALGVPGHEQPTFIMVNEHHGRLALFHVDLCEFRRAELKTWRLGIGGKRRHGG